MKLKNAISFIAALGLAVNMAVSVCAKTKARVEYDAENESITVSVDTDKKMKTAVLTVEKDGKFYVLAEFERTSADVFSYSCNLPSDCGSGKYTAKVTIGGETATADFEHINTTLANLAMEKINKASKDTFAEELESVSSELAVDMEEFNTHKKLVTELFFLYKPSTDMTVADFSVLYQKVMSLSKLAQTEEDSETDEFLSENAKKINFDYDKLSKLSDSEKREIYKRFRDAKYTFNDIETEYSHWFCLADINTKSENSVKIYKSAILDTYKDILKLDTDDFEESADESEVIRIVMSQNYTTVEELCDSFYAAVKKVGKKKTSSGGSSGGGGGSRGGSMVKWQPDTKTEDKEPENPAVSDKKLPFSDVPDGHWCEESVKNLYNLGIINGATQEKFMPDNSVTRAEFAKMVVCAFLSNGQTVKAADFKDVNENDWFYEYVNSAAQSGIIKGNSEGAFMPHSKITRQDMAVILCRALEKKNINLIAGEVVFSDESEISEYAKPAVVKLASSGILKGMSDGSFAPIGVLTRAQAAKAIDEALKKCQ